MRCGALQVGFPISVTLSQTSVLSPSNVERLDFQLLVKSVIFNFRIFSHFLT